MHIGSATAFGILCTLALITAVGIYAGKKVKSARDFTTGSNLGAPYDRRFPHRHPGGRLLHHRYSPVGL